MSDIQFDCSECGRMIAVAQESLGFEVVCPHCTKTVAVPWEKFVVEAQDRPNGDGSLAPAPQPIQKVEAMIVRCSCNDCKNQIEFDAKRCGEKIECPRCHAQTLLPKADQLKPIGDERTWSAESGEITHVKCPFCRRMVPVRTEQREGREFVRFHDHKTKAGWSCYGSWTCYRVAKE